MRTIKSINELNIPPDYKAYISAFLKNLSTVPFISRVILFGSCAREEVTEYSDIDIFITANREITLDDEMIIDWQCRPKYTADTLPLDVIVQTETAFRQFENAFGMVQKQVNKDGVDLSGLL
ncbi:MAG: nucleotidyltransferase domain-containing protein [Turicibacter sp.]|nr:nucleotidyltransferase domain-containing protein [Turicibacter sp.]